MLKHAQQSVVNQENGTPEVLSFEKKMTETPEQIALDTNIAKTRNRKSITIDPKVVLEYTRPPVEKIDEKILYRTKIGGREAEKDCIVIKTNFDPIIIDLDLNPEFIFRQFECRTSLVDLDTFKKEWQESFEKAKTGWHDRRKEISLIGIRINDPSLKGLSYLYNTDKILEKANVVATADGYTKVESITEFLNPQKLTERFGRDIGINNSIQYLTPFECAHLAAHMKNGTFFDKRFFAPISDSNSVFPSAQMIPDITIASKFTTTLKKHRRVFGGIHLSYSEVDVRKKSNAWYVYKIKKNAH